MRFFRSHLHTIGLPRLAAISAAWCITAGFLATAAYLTPRADLPALLQGLVDEHTMIVVSMCVIVAVASGAVAGAVHAMDDYMPDGGADAGDTHAGFPPPMRTASARVIERQTDCMLQQADRQARQRERLAQRLAREVLPPSYDGTAARSTARPTTSA